MDICKTSSATCRTFCWVFNAIFKLLQPGPWWRHQIEPFSALLTLCAGNSPVTDGFPSQRPVARSFDVFFDLRPNKRLSKQSRRRWFETPRHSLWRHCNAGVETVHWYSDIIQEEQTLLQYGNTIIIAVVLINFFIKIDLCISAGLTRGTFRDHEVRGRWRTRAHCRGPGP